MNLSDVKRTIKKHKRGRRVGRGVGSGNGKTSAKGHKGAKARAGYSRKPTFEGGQMALAQKLPKRGFNNARYTHVYQLVQLAQLDQLEDGTVVEEELLEKNGFGRRGQDGFKVLGVGTLSKKLTVRLQAASAPAKKAIEEAGGTLEIVPGGKRRKSKKTTA